MTTMQEEWDLIEAKSNHVLGSLIVKSSDERGCTLKWLEEENGIGKRKERFFHTKDGDSEGQILKREVLYKIDVEPAS